MYSIINKNIKPEMPRISAVINYINHKNGKIKLDEFRDHVIKIFCSSGNKSDTYVRELKIRIDDIINLLEDQNIIKREGNIIHKNL